MLWYGHLVSFAYFPARGLSEEWYGVRVWLNEGALGLLAIHSMPGAAWKARILSPILLPTHRPTHWTAISSVPVIAAGRETVFPNH